MHQELNKSEKKGRAEELSPQTNFRTNHQEEEVPLHMPSGFLLYSDLFNLSVT
jgi:hypothetical protein